MKNVKYWRWRYRNPATGQMCRTIFPFTAEEAAVRYPDPVPIEGTMVLRQIEQKVDFKRTQPGDFQLSEHEMWRDSSLDLDHGLDVEEVTLDSLPGELRDSFA